MKSMRILQVSPFTFDEVGGVSEHVRNITSRLAKKHDVTVYVTDGRKSFPRYQDFDGAKVMRFTRYSPNDAYFFSLDMLLALRKSEFDVVHAHCYHALPMHFAPFAKYKKLIITTHFHGVGHSTFRNSLVRLFKPFGERALTKAERIIAVSEYEKQLVQREFGFDDDKLVVIPNGVILNDFSALRKKQHNSGTILHVGNLLEYKGSRHLIEVLPKLSENFKLEIVGRGPMRPLLEKRALQLKVRDRIKFYDRLSRQDLLQKYADADIFVLLSRYEAYSIVVAEALTAGTPCIVTKTSALTEWVDEKTCFGVNFPVDLDSLARKIEYVLAHTNTDKEQTRKWVGTKILDWDNVTQKLEDIYNQ